MGITPPRKGSTHPSIGVAYLRPAAPAALLAGFALLLAGCGGGGTDSSSAASGSAGGGQSTKAVTIEDYAYKPATISVPVGSAVSFTNQDSTAHTATSKQAGAFDTDAVQSGKSGSVKLEKAGTFAYYCVFHPFMKGTIVVE